ncbi:butyrophilin subfamily 3 member A2-like [Symphorus nematophorus]
MVGDDIILPCHIEPAVDAHDLTVEWARPDLEPRFVHFRRDGVELQPEEHQAFRGRTSLSNNKLKCGDISLKLSQVELSDAGTYRCLIPRYSAESAVELAVGSVSSPDVKISKVSSRVLLECKSKGWYPEPEVLLLDGGGNVLSAGPTETVRGPDGLYTVSSRVTVEKRHSNGFTCRVQQKDINQIRETQIQIPDDLFMVQASPAIRITICVVVCVISIVAFFLIVWKGRQEKKVPTETSNNSYELQLLMKEERDRERLMTESDKINYLENTKAKLHEELQKTEGELQHVQQVITALKNQKEDLNNQRDKLISLQHEEKTKIEENTKNEEKKRLLNKDKKKDKREKNLHDLQKKKTEHEKLLENTEKLLKTTDDLIIKMTERKAKLERDMEQINGYLKETERKREESLRTLETERQREESLRKLETERQREDSQRKFEAEQSEREGKN